MVTGPGAGHIEQTALAEQVGGVLDRVGRLGGDASRDGVVIDGGVRMTTRVGPTVMA